MLMIVMESFSNQQEFYSIPNLVNVYSLGQQKRLENNNSIREKLASVIQRKMIPAKFLQEEYGTLLYRKPQEYYYREL